MLPGCRNGVAAKLKNLRSLIIANSPASMELWVQEANRLRAAAARRPGDADPA